jgi:hypothetical protein
MRVTLLLALLALVACRPNPGQPNYPDLEPTGSGLPGPDPWKAGEDRLSIGLFYEGGASQIIEINDIDTHYYIYSNTYTTEPDLEDRVEGLQSDLILPTGVGWWGGGIHWDAPQDMSQWTTLWVSLKSGDAGFADIDLAMNDGAEVRLSVSDYGWLNDGEWQHLSIPLQDFVDGGIDLGTIEAPFVMVAEAGTLGDLLKIDNLYFTSDE